MVSRSENLPVLPQIASRILTLIDDPLTSNVALEKVLDRDPAIVAKVLRIAGSAYYGGTPSSTTSRAIAVLGMSKTKSLVLGLVFQQAACSKDGKGQFNRVEFWRHSLATAIASQVIAKIISHPQPETLYFAGMVHDIGILVLDRFASEEFNRAVSIATCDSITLADAEMGVFGFNHAHVGEILAKKWGLNLTQSRSIRYHHEPENEDCGMSLSTAIISTADIIAHRTGFKNQSPTATLPEPPQEVLDFIKLPINQIGIIEKAVCLEVERMTEAFGIAA